MANPLSESDFSRAKAFVVDGRTRGHLLFALAWVALADWLFYSREVGWTLGAFGGLTGLAVVLLGEPRFRTPPSVLLGGAFFCLCVRAAVEPEPLVVFLGVAFCAAFTLTLRGGWSWSFACWVRRGLLFAGGLAKSLALSIGVLALLPLAPLLALAKVRRLRAWLIPALFGLVFLGLFALANPVIALALKSVREAFGWLGGHLPVFVSLPRMLFWVMAGAWLWTLLRHAPRPAEDPAEPLASCCVPDCAELQARGVVRNALIVFNALFALQTASDIWYLWGGGALPQGMTYAQYAHRGAYPLVVTALLAPPCCSHWPPRSPRPSRRTAGTT